MNKKRYLLILSVIFVIFSLIFYGKTGNILIDFSREAYIPYQLNNDNALIKDIFLIYGPFGYIINSILYKLSTNINIILILAHIISYLILLAFYFITKRFTNSLNAMLFSIAFIAISIFSNSTFSFVLPYSYSTLWAVFGIYLVLYSLLYGKKNILFLSLGLILSNKIEFFLPVFAISIFYFIYKKEKFLKNSLLMFIFPLFSCGYLILNQISENEIYNNYIYLKNMLNTNSLKYLYQGMGTFFEKKYFIYNIINFFKFFIIIILSYFLYNKNLKKISYSVIIISFLFINTNFSLNLAFLISLGLMFFATIKKIISKEEIILFLFSIILCSKSIFAINSLSYSNFGYLLLIFFIYLQCIKFIKPYWLNFMFISFFSLNFIGNIGNYLLNPKEKISTNIGKLWVNKYDYNLFKKTNEFIEKNIKDDENFVILPEGQLFNLINRKEHPYYNSTFTPLDFETFGEKNLTKELMQNKPEYIIFFPRNTMDYGKPQICYDYAVNFCKIISENYIKTESFGDNIKVTVYKIKKKN